MIEFAIVGLGPWGLCVLERTVDRARRVGTTVRVHVVEPGQLGGGVYSAAQPDYLILNNPCGQLSLYASPDENKDPPYAVGLFEWAVRQGYHRVGHAYKIGSGGETILPSDYLPRRLMGEYLAWFYEALVANSPNNLEIVRHFAAATDITPEIGGRESVSLSDDTKLTVDHVVLTSGHTFNEEPGSDPSEVRYLRPYPVEYFESAVPPGESIAVAGMGLVGYDLITALTVGRGGEYKDEGDRKEYVPSGREPDILLYSRSGVPYCAKSAHGVDPTGDYQPIVCTPQAFRDMTNPSGSPLRRRVDFRDDLLPLLYAEMQVRFYVQSAMQRSGAAAAASVRDELESSLIAGTFARAINRLEPIYGPFDPVSVVFADDGATFESAAAYQAHLYGMVEIDLDDALMVGGSPVKAAQEVTRILRDQMRGVIEYGGLSMQSFIDFQSNVRGRINRIEAGPPPVRSQQLLALLDAGVVSAPFGPYPDVSTTSDGLIRIRSTRLSQPYESSVKYVVRGHLDLPSLARSSSLLLSRLYTKGRLTQFSYGDTTVGSVAISEDFHPYDAEGRVQTSLSLLGVLTEGVRYFTHYLPSPRSRLRAVYDAQKTVEAIIG
ncbi:MAG TPA: FAD/NAD(P)-binding protein [Acidimicrobiales bacterium]